MVNLQIEYFNVRRLDGHCWMGTDGEGRVLVTGAGEFIGHHLVTCLVERGYSVRGIDLKAPEYKKAASDDFVIADLWGHDECLMVTKDIDEIYHFAADMRSTIASRAFSGSCGLITVHPSISEPMKW
jgi:nucleoside-diphosphate-sugar epimerase